MVNLNIDAQTYADWQMAAASQGLSVEDWLKSITRTQVLPASGLTSEERLKRFDSLTQQLAKMNVNSGGHLDDSHETIHRQQSLS